MSRSRFNRGSLDYGRKNLGRRDPGKSFLIVSEGEKSEPTYLNCVLGSLKLSTAEVKIIHPPATDPEKLTRHAIQLKEKRQQEARNGFLVPYDEVWVVLDLENVHSKRRSQFQQACELGRGAGIEFAVSDPCFEFWLLLHFEYTTSPFRDCGEVMGRLRKWWKDYEKGSAPGESILMFIPQAVENARRVRTHHEACEGGGNPSTRIDDLISGLNEAAREHHRFSIRTM